MNGADLPGSEAVVIAEAIRTQGDFLDDTEITAADFVTNEGAWAYTAIRKMMATGIPIDTMSVGIEEPRVEVWLWKTSNLPTHAAAFHAEEIHKAGVRRRMLAIAEKIKHTAATESVDTLIDTARRDIDEAAGLRRTTTTFVGDLIAPVLADSQRERVVYRTPWSELTDTLGGGFRPGALYVLAARPALGKTALLLQMLTGLADYGMVAFSSLEMPQDELVRRLIAQGAQISHGMLERGQPLAPVFAEKIERWRETAPVTMAIDDRSTVGVSDIRAFARSVARTGPLAAIAVDYLQLISGPSGMKRYEVVSDITRQLKILAREMNAPVIALSQLNRGSEHRTDKRPMLADLRESGSIEQDADLVMLLHRDPLAEADHDPLLQRTTLPLELMVAKNRHGPTGTITLDWEGAFMRAY